MLVPWPMQTNCLLDINFEDDFNPNKKPKLAVLFI